MEEKLLKILASDIARQPLVRRYLEIYKLLQDLNTHVEQKENRTTKYIA